MDIHRIIAILKGSLTNIVAMCAPKTYVQLVDKTGRGGKQDSGKELLEYCLKVFNDYQRMLLTANNNQTYSFKDKTIIEYGPGDFLGVALLFLCKGAKQVYCIDRFPLINDKIYLDLYNKIIDTHSNNDDLAGLKWDEIINRKIIYISAKDGIYPLQGKADLIVSTAALEHCNNLERTFFSMHRNLRPNGLMTHKVDLTSHGMHLKTPLDFLFYPKFIWSMMTCYKGYPNRWRRNTYRELLQQFNFEELHDESLYEYTAEELNTTRNTFSRNFRNLPDEELLCSDFFFVAKKEGE